MKVFCNCYMIFSGVVVSSRGIVREQGVYDGQRLMCYLVGSLSLSSDAVFGGFLKSSLVSEKLCLEAPYPVLMSEPHLLQLHLQPADLLLLLLL